MAQFEAEIVESISAAETFGRNVQISPASAYGKELAKHEQYPTPWAPKPGNPYVYRQFPMMLYRAQKHPRTGKLTVLEPHPLRHQFHDQGDFDRAVMEADYVNRNATKKVNDAAEYQKAMEAGWRDDPPAALEFAEKRHEAKSEGAAIRNWEDRNMSPEAKAEAAKAEEAASGTHLEEIPAQPIKRRVKKEQAPA